MEEKLFYSLGTMTVNRGFLFLVILAAGIFAAFVPFAPLFLSADAAVLFRDLSYSFLPAKKVWLEGILHDGAVPYWNFLSLGGTPFWADCNAGPLYPLNWLIWGLRSLGIERSFSLFIAAHFSFIFWGSYFLLRRRHYPVLLSIFFSFCFSWCGLSIGAYTLVHILSGLVAIPWFFLFWELYKRQRKMLMALLAGGFLALPIYGGDPQFSYLLALYVVLESGWKFFRTRQGTVLLDVLWLSLFSFLCSSAQLLPSLGLLRETDRSEFATVGFSVWSLHPMRFLEVLWPQFFGTLSPGPSFWGQWLTKPPVDTFFLFSLYIGAFAALMIFMGLFLYGKRVLHFSKLRWLLLWSLFFAVLALGSYSPFPLYDGLKEILPLWRSFRYPERMMVWWNFCVLLLAAAMSRRLLLWSILKEDKKLWIWGGPFLLLVMSLVAFTFSRSAPTAGLPALKVAIFSVALAMVFAFLIDQRKLRNSILLIFIGLGLVDFVTEFPRLIFFQRSSLTRRENYAAASKIQADIQKRNNEISAGKNFHFLSLNSFDSGWRQVPLAIDEQLDPASMQVRSAWEGMTGNTPMFWGFADVTGYYSLQPKQKAMFWAKLRNQSANKLMDMLGVYYILARSAGQNLEAKVNSSALDYLFFPKNVVFSDSQERSTNLVLDPHFPYQTSVVLETSSPRGLAPRGGTAAPTIHVLAKTGRSFAIEVRSKGIFPGGYLVWNETYSKHWSSNLGPVLHANLWAMAVYVPALAAGGKVKIDFIYSDPSIKWGLVGTSLWLLLVLLALFIEGNTYLAHKRLELESP